MMRDAFINDHDERFGPASGMSGCRSLPHAYEVFVRRVRRGSSEDPSEVVGRIRRRPVGRLRRNAPSEIPSEGSVGSPSGGSVGMVRRKVRRKSSGGSVGRSSRLPGLEFEFGIDFDLGFGIGFELGKRHSSSGNTNPTLCVLE
eukprot:gene5851-biopygen3858